MDPVVIGMQNDFYQFLSCFVCRAQAESATLSPGVVVIIVLAQDETFGAWALRELGAWVVHVSCYICNS